MSRWTTIRAELTLMLLILLQGSFHFQEGFLERADRPSPPSRQSGYRLADTRAAGCCRCSTLALVVSTMSSSLQTTIKSRPTRFTERVAFHGHEKRVACARNCRVRETDQPFPNHPTRKQRCRFNELLYRLRRARSTGRATWADRPLDRTSSRERLASVFFSRSVCVSVAVVR